MLEGGRFRTACAGIELTGDFEQDLETLLASIDQTGALVR
jgi:hypothetical protein